MNDDKVRSDERYFADIRAVLEKFYKAGDSLFLVRVFYEQRKCQMCGDKVDIFKCFELQNARTKNTIICGRNCIVKYAIVVRKMKEVPKIVFPKKYSRDAEKINRIRPNTVDLDLEEDEEQKEGLCDCGIPLSYCPDCDNEVCFECDTGCTCVSRDEELDYDWGASEDE
jgi:hypothetical protein